jgi:hypothetical protein
MFSTVTARTATIVTRKLEEAFTWTESEITYEKLNQWTICQELRLFRHLACQTEQFTGA